VHPIKEIVPAPGVHQRRWCRTVHGLRIVVGFGLSFERGELKLDSRGLRLGDISVLNVSGPDLEKHKGLGDEDPTQDFLV